MTDALPAIVAASLGGGSLVWVGKRFGAQVLRAVWRSRGRILEEMVADDGTPVPVEPVDAEVPAAARDKVLSTVLEQVEQIRSHTVFMDSRLDAVEARLEERDRKIVQLEAELTKLRAENERLSGANRKLRLQITELEYEIAQLRASS